VPIPPDLAAALGPEAAQVFMAERSGHLLSSSSTWWYVALPQFAKGLLAKLAEERVDHRAELRDERERLHTERQAYIELLEARKTALAEDYAARRFDLQEQRVIDKAEIEELRRLLTAAEARESALNGERCDHAAEASELSANCIESVIGVIYCLDMLLCFGMHLDACRG
jgi:hypothetical protein